MKKLLIILLSILGLFTLTSCNKSVNDIPEIENPDKDPEGDIDDSSPLVPLVPATEIDNSSPLVPLEPSITVKQEMSTSEIKDYLEERTYMVTMFNNYDQSYARYGSGWLIDMSDNHYYIATNRHVIENYDSQAETLCINSKWDEMRQFYDYESYDYGDSQKTENTLDTTEAFKTAYKNCMPAEIVYTQPFSGSGHDYFDFSILRIDRLAESTYIKDGTTPIKLKSSEDTANEINAMDNIYNLSSGRFRFGSFFQDTKVLYSSWRQMAAWSPNVFYKGAFWPLDTGPGSSGSAYVDKYGEYVGTSTYNYDFVWSISEGESQHAGKQSLSGVSSIGVIDYILPEYFKVLDENTMLSS